MTKEVLGPIVLKIGLIQPLFMKLYNEIFDAGGLKIIEFHEKVRL